MFVSLHNHTNYSILNSLTTPKELLTRAKELNHHAVAITDYGTLSGAWDALNASREVGIKLIIGNSLYFTNDVNNHQGKYRNIILIAKNHQGYKNLLALSRDGFDHAIQVMKKVVPVVDWKILEKYKEGLICLTGDGNGILGQLINTKKFEEAEDTIYHLKQIFGTELGIEIQTHNLNRNGNNYIESINQIFTNYHCVRLAEKCGVKIIPTNNSFYLKKEDAEIHDVLLAIGSMQPVYSNARPKYNVPDFYLKEYKEVVDFFARNFGEEKAKLWCANTIEFSDKCEISDWIDPKFSNPSGKELPLFPIKDEKDYDNFLVWLEKQKPEIQKLDKDKSFLRFRCGKAFLSMVPADKEKEYRERLEEELDVLEYHGFSSYMLIVSDYINWAKKNGIRVGAGRGCLTGETKVLTSKGFIRLDKIEINDEVFSHTGKKQNVLKSFKFDVSNEKLLKLYTENSFGTISLTKDHKVFASKIYESDGYKKSMNNGFKTSKSLRYNKLLPPTWIQADKLNKGDMIYTSFPKKDCTQLNLPKSYNLQYSSTRNSNLDKNTTIIVDDEFMYLLGRFTGDGWVRTPSKKTGYDAYCIGIAFNSNDTIGIERFMNYFIKIGLNPCPYKHKTKDLVQMMIHNKSLVEIFLSIFNDYKNTSSTKHLPYFFRDCNTEQLKYMLSGLIDSDGCKTDEYRTSIDTTSYRLANEVKELLLYLNIKSSVNSRQPFQRGKYLCNTSYKIRFTKLYLDNNTDSGYFSKILKIEEDNSQFVYDIMVDKDHSYLTSNYIVHNSVGGSLVGYLLKIHEADPIQYGMIFARFHNKSKTSYPDIDVDFSSEGRDRVQKYLRDKYGEDQIARVSNFSTITPKVFARDLARSCELGSDRQASVQLGTDIADVIPKKYNEKDVKTFDQAIAVSPLFEEYTKRYPPLRKFSKICGSYRNYATHAAGLVITSRPIRDFVPTRKDKDGLVALELDKDSAESNGLVKFDTLGVSTLDVIDNTYRLIKEAGKQLPPDPPDYNQYDQKTYDLISRGDTLCVFQLGTSSGTMDLCKRIKPKTIEDISHINSLARPSARGIRDLFIATKEGKKKAILIHPALKRAFGSTYGFGLYEESLMYLAQDVAGWDLHKADRLRKMTKAKGKNNTTELRSEFITDSKNNNFPEDMAIKIWDEVIEKFTGYGFNISHSVLYSMIAYHTAYLKAHFPIEFLLSNLINENQSGALDAEKKINVIKQEIRKYGIKILPPDINKSEMTYKLQPDGSLLTGLDALKFVGTDAIIDILNKRPFNSFDEFIQKTDTRQVAAGTIRALSVSGALDCFGISKKLMYSYCSDYRKKYQVWLKKHNPLTEKFEFEWPIEKEFSQQDLYAFEKHYLGEVFSARKKDAYGQIFHKPHYVIKDIIKMKDKDNVASCVAEIKDSFEFKIKKETSRYFGQLMMKVLVEDQNGDVIGLTIFPDRLKEIKKAIDRSKGKFKFESGLVMHFSGKVNMYENNLGIIFEGLFDLAAPPKIPKNLKHKKVISKKYSNTVEDIKKININNTEKMIESIEDDLFTDGVIDLDEEDKENEEEKERQIDFFS
jgi:DNA polymerase-3 subunit alpha